jgi:hypothetical protein
MYNIAQHYENVYHYLKTIIADPRVAYLYPFGATQPENVEFIRNDTDPPARRGPLFIFYDQEPLSLSYNSAVFDHIKATTQGPYILVSTEKVSEEKELICEQYGFADINYFFHIFAAADWYRGNQYIPNIVAPQDRQIEKTYITFNRLTSNDRIYRSLFVNELYVNNLLDAGYVSFSKTCPDGGDFDKNLLGGIKKFNISPALVRNAIDNINQLPELRIDFADQEHIPNQSMILSPMNQLMKSFVFVVTETCYWQTKTHLTEKIFKPIVLHMPFLLLGCSNNLSYLRDYGFKTFDDYWDEGYDSITDPIERLQAVTRILKRLSNLSSSDQKSMLLDMQPILDHNYNLFNSKQFVDQEWQHLTSALTDISKLYQFKTPYKLNVKLGQSIPIDPT